MTFKVVTAPDPILRQQTEKISLFDDEFRVFLDQMMETMIQGNGAGLAAPQIGKSLRLFTMLITEDKPYKMVNPEILTASKERCLYKEGCLSFPKVYLEIERPRDVRVKYMNEFGDILEEEFTGWEARCIQHELDHLNGVLFVDELSKDRRDFIIRKIQKGTPSI